MSNIMIGNADGKAREVTGIFIGDANGKAVSIGGEKVTINGEKVKKNLNLHNLQYNNDLYTYEIVSGTNAELTHSIEYYYLNNDYLFLFNKFNFSCTIINDNTGEISYSSLPLTEYKYLFVQKTIEDDYIVILEYDTTNNNIHRIILYYYLTNELINFKNNEVLLNFDIRKINNTVSQNLNNSAHLQHIELDIKTNRFYYLENGLNLKCFDCINNTDITTNIVLTEPCKNLVLIDNIFYCFAEQRGYNDYYLSKGNKIVAIILNEQNKFSIISSNISATTPNSYRYSTIIYNSKMDIFCLFLSRDNSPDQVSVLQIFNKNTNTWESIKSSSKTYETYYCHAAITLSGYCKWIYDINATARLRIIDPITLDMNQISAKTWLSYGEGNNSLDLSLHSKYYDFSIWQNGDALCGSIKNNNNLPFL